MDIYLNKPYYDIEQTELVMLKPQQMNSDIKLNLKVNLREKIEGKCNKFGYINKIYKILEYTDGFISGENLSGGAIYKVNYHCRIFSPLENTSIIGEIILINPDLIIVINGPIKIFIPRELINQTVFDINRNFMLKNNNSPLQLNQKVIVTIKDKKINPGDKYIKCIGYLSNIADDKQIKKFYDEEGEDPSENTPENNFIL